MTGEPAERSAWDSPGFLLWHATLAWQREMRAALAPHGLTHVQFVVLASTWWLGTRGGPPRQGDVAVHAGIDPMMTSQVVRALEARGALAREPDPADARARLLSLTAEGGRALLAALADVEEADRRFFVPATADGDAAVLRLLRALVRRDAQGRPTG